MRLIRTHVSNFKLLENVHLEFSTDPEKPLTVIRAENGSGKTSLLFALSWAFFGPAGLPSDARGLRLISANSAPGLPVTVQVSVEFEHVDRSVGTQRYRLVRTAVETPKAGSDVVEKGPESIKVARLTDAGDESVPPEIISKFFPQRLQNIFFTNGEDVQTFIAGATADETQQLVLRAIRQLLGLDSLETAIGDLESLTKKFRTEAARDAGGAIIQAEEDLQVAERTLEELQAKALAIRERIGSMRDQKATWEKELATIQGIGELDELNAERGRIERDIGHADQRRKKVYDSLRKIISSEDMSWQVNERALEKGLSVLQELADRNVIPGISIQVLSDRLSLGECICGAKLDEHDPACADRRLFVRRLIVEQSRASDMSQRLTKTWHVARSSRENFRARCNQGGGVLEAQRSLVEELRGLRDSIGAKRARLDQIKEIIGKIDNDRVRDLSEKIRNVETKIGNSAFEEGGLVEQIRTATQSRDRSKVSRDELDRVLGKKDKSSIRRDVSQDLLDLANNAMGRLRGDYVSRVATKTSELFIKIVGSSPEFDGAVFTGVTIDEHFNIIVESREGRHLNPSFELNGASQRALTLSFIWALTEVAGTTAPRIIDTPLGMVAGGVKTRLVDAITAPAAPGAPNFQVVLLLTRSEIRDVEGLLDERAAAYTTMSCSKDYPVDLKYPWDVAHPVVRTCRCTHRESCRICARKYDEEHGVVFTDRTGVDHA